MSMDLPQDIIEALEAGDPIAEQWAERHEADLPARTVEVPGGTAARAAGVVQGPIKPPRYYIGDRVVYTRNCDGSEVTGTVKGLHDRRYPKRRDTFWQFAGFDGSNFAYRLGFDAATKAQVGHPVVIPEHRHHHASGWK